MLLKVFIGVENAPVLCFVFIIKNVHAKKCLTYMSNTLNFILKPIFYIYLNKCYKNFAINKLWYTSNLILNLDKLG